MVVRYIHEEPNDDRDIFGERCDGDLLLVEKREPNPFFEKMMDGALERFRKRKKEVVEGDTK
jgi:hypothetical protein